MELSRAYHLQILKENIQFCGLEGFHLSRMSLMTLFIVGSLAWKFASLRFTGPRWLATLAWSKSLLNALVTFSGNTIAWNTSKPPYIGALGLLQRKILNACCTTASCQAPTCNFHCKTRETWQTHDSLQGQHSNDLNCLTIANHIDPQCLCHACDCGSKRLLSLRRKLHCQVWQRWQLDLFVEKVYSCAPTLQQLWP